MPEAFEAPFMQKALLESLLLAALAGMLGSWIVLRRLAFYTHGVGTAAFPGLVIAGPVGVAPQVTALAASLLYAGGVGGLRRRVASDAATGLALVGALALGVILASDVYETGAGVDRLLFGSLIGLSDQDLWLTAGVVALVAVLDLVLRRAWLAQGFDPTTARALGVRPALADAVLMIAVAAAAVVALDAVGALLVTAVLVIPAATVRLVATSVGAPAGRHGAAGRPRGRGRALARLRAERRPGAGDRRAGRCRVRGRGGGAAMRVADVAGGYAPGAEVLRGVTFALEPGTIAAVLGPNGGGKTTLFRALLGELAFRTGTVELDGRPAYVPQTDRTRLDFPVSALDVVLMGAYGRTPAWRRIARADRQAARAALGRVGLEDVARKRFGALSGGQRQRVLIARALLQDSRVLLLDEPLSGVDTASAVRIETVFDELRAEGRILLVATHDVEQARRWDRVVCLNGEQVAFGRPPEVLTTDVLRRTYGPELVVLAGGEQAVAVDHHRH